MSDDFSKNHPAPLVDPKINRALKEIAGLTPSGLPVLRMIWGQAEEPEGHTWTRFGERAHRYRHHWEKTYAMAEPVYDLETGKVKGYGKLYYYGEVLPVSKLLVPVEIKKSIGVCRYYFEIAMPVDEAEWEAERYDPPVPFGTSPEVIATLLETGRIRDEWGPPPTGLVEYFPLSIQGMLMRFERHDTHMVEVGTETIAACCAEKRKGGRKCYGSYRAPTMRDVEMVRRAFAENQQARSFFDKADSTRTAWDMESRFKDAVRDAKKREAQHADDMQQAMSCLSENRLQGDGHGLDLMKYSTPSKVMPGTELGNERKPDASSAANN